MNPRPRIEVVYMALHHARCKEIMLKVGTGDYNQRGEDNSLLMELAKIIDNELQAEVDRRGSLGGASGISAKMSDYVAGEVLPPQ